MYLLVYPIHLIEVYFNYRNITFQICKMKDNKTYFQGLGVVSLLFLPYLLVLLSSVKLLKRKKKNRVPAFNSFTPHLRLHTFGVLPSPFSWNFFVFVFVWHTLRILKLLGQGLDPSCSCNLPHSCGNTGSLTHCSKLSHTCTSAAT